MPAARIEEADNDPDDLGRIEMQVLRALAALRKAGNNDVPILLVVICAGYCNPSSQEVVNAFNRLLELGWMKQGRQHDDDDSNRQCVSLVDDENILQRFLRHHRHERVSVILSDEVPPMTDKAFQKHTSKMMGMGLSKKCVVEICTTLSDGNYHEQKDIAEELGLRVNSHTFFLACDTLRNHKLLETSPTDRSRIRLTDRAFPFGRP